MTMLIDETSERNITKENHQHDMEQASGFRRFLSQVCIIFGMQDSTRKTESRHKRYGIRNQSR